MPDQMSTKNGGQTRIYGFRFEKCGILPLSLGRVQIKWLLTERIEQRRRVSGFGPTSTRRWWLFQEFAWTSLQTKDDICHRARCCLLQEKVFRLSLITYFLLLNFSLQLEQPQLLWVAGRHDCEAILHTLSIPAFSS